MSDGTDLIYQYDGSIEGLFCCIFESYLRKEVPDRILGPEETTLFACREIVTEDSRALRVWRSLEHMGGEASDWVRTGWLACMPDKGQLLFRFMRMLYQSGPAVCARLDDPTVNQVFRGVRAVRHEGHMLCGFVRFSERAGILTSVIHPKGFVLPLIREHFSDRLAQETFIIYDATHGAALMYQPGKSAICSVEGLELAEPDEGELEFERVWKRYYDAIGIEQRRNPRCRASFMPRRFWRDLPEMRMTSKRILHETRAAVPHCSHVAAGCKTNSLDAARY